MTLTKNNNTLPWPVLRFDRYRESVETVHLWTQISGKIRLRQMPWINHSWHVTLYVNSRGLTTGSMPYSDGSFEIVMDFVAHEVEVTTNAGAVAHMPLYPRTVADFYTALFDLLRGLDIEAGIYGKPNESADAIPFAKDNVHGSYDKVEMNAIFQALTRIEPVFVRFRSGFTGKVSPVHFFWG